MRISAETIADMERVGREWPDGIHTCEELQHLEPGRRPCTCGRCPAHPVIGATRACPDCGRPQHYTGTENGWCHDAGWYHDSPADTWDCADPRKAGA